MNHRGSRPAWNDFSGNPVCLPRTQKVSVISYTFKVFVNVYLPREIDQANFLYIVFTEVF